MMEYHEKRQWANQLLDGLEKTLEISATNPKSTAAYWNGDDWGSIQGFHEAEKWIRDELINYVLKHLEKLDAENC